MLRVVPTDRCKLFKITKQQSDKTPFQTNLSVPCVLLFPVHPVTQRTDKPVEKVGLHSVFVKSLANIIVV